MPKPLHTHLSRRESQIMDVVYRLGEASVADVARRLPDEPAYNAVRVTLGILEKKGYLTHRQDGPRYLYAPAVPADKAKLSALQHLMQTFFSGSPSRAILTLLDMSSAKLSEKELDEIAAWVAAARREAETDE